jgi:FKBP-type peptidyl-prolyl cis-trans isomerase
VILSDLAYGDAGSGEVIPPGTTLKFEVELFRVI